MQTIKNKTISLHVHDSGNAEGPTILFANSLGTDLRVWDQLLPHLPQDFRFIRFDKRGHGLSDCPAAPYAIDDLVDDALAVLDGFEIERVHFVGLSIGGMIGQGLASRAPSRLKSLTLMDTAAKIGTADMWNGRIETVRANGIGAISAAVVERWFSKAAQGQPDQLRPYINMLERTPVEGYAGCCAAIAAADLTQSTKALDLPVLAIAGDEDLATPPDLVRGTSDLCNGTYCEISSAGHLPCVEQPKAVAKVLNAFLKEHDNG